MVMCSDVTLSFSFQIHVVPYPIRLNLSVAVHLHADSQRRLTPVSSIDLSGNLVNWDAVCTMKTNGSMTQVTTVTIVVPNDRGMAGGLSGIVSDITSM